MASFDENIVREYFELNGFFARQLRKHVVRSRKKPVEETVELLVYNPSAPTEGVAPNFQLFSSDMASIRQAIVVVHGWQHTRVTPAILKSSARLFDFLKKDVLSQADALFAVEEGELEDAATYRKVLVLPGLPTAEPQRSECIALFKEQGVDGVIAFSTILEDLLRHVEVNHSYQKSELLQLVRVLKVYDMVQAPQLNLF
ncbi:MULTISPECIES: hypothetical protein [unclassified Lentimonas]|uniref:hypothetical protein n=1 Tax=unclassified Lentimonas TaxID=2630993 RepID=UPI001327E4DF|nr:MULTISPECIES: hypothetical protein [unclassified Lentimonas]CAA6677099.1 Unannotated [Lentimonas sp. CC4]CAA6686279.1 Unannotated [Lentimonas sp. CC6]CAA7074307.1 Unannotated [Lentimonas sp. CC4]CAA7171138.1 Unannotated [Lentimonas sp. CC21]CAA7180100.1 Unannotated [Lentimonas sp. CC8]